MALWDPNLCICHHVPHRSIDVLEVLASTMRADGDYYSTLGSFKNASKSEIKSAYRKLARQYHPDVNKEASAEKKFKEISNAYEVLSDDEKRSIYDRYGEAGLQGCCRWCRGIRLQQSFLILFETFFGSMGGMGGGTSSSESTYARR
ncbi:hypothetical protein O6H91_Y552600 [Diphasiastrum complanatum]|nr:hypothetical protein O6H91_Y552600 [Diphasiastrum complanatum]